jgi:hypothetical protein
MVERYIEVTDEYVKQLEQEIDNLKKINEKHKKLNGELREENKKQKEVIDKVINYIVKETKSMPTNGCKIRLIEILDILKDVSE